MPTNPPCARRCHAPNRCLRSTRSATAGNRCPAAGLAAPSSRRKSWRTALRRNRRSHAHAAADSDVDKKDGSQPSAGPCWGPTSLAADPVCVCPSTWAKCSTRRWRVNHSARAATRVTIVEPAERSCGSKEDVSSMSPLLRPLAPAEQPRWCRGVVIAAAILGAAAPLFGPQGPPLLPGYVIVGEALSSARAEDSIQFAARMFSAPDMESICRTARAAEVVQLRSEVSQLRLRLGEPFRPGTLRITARDASGAVLPNVPLAVEVSGPPNVFARERLAQLVDEDGSIVPSRPASVRFRVRTICPGAGADTFVRAEISQE